MTPIPHLRQDMTKSHIKKRPRKVSKVVIFYIFAYQYLLVVQVFLWFMRLMFFANYLVFGAIRGIVFYTPIISLYDVKCNYNLLRKV